jgi:hypothetical protein
MLSILYAINGVFDPASKHAELTVLPYLHVLRSTSNRGGQMSLRAHSTQWAGLSERERWQC